MALHLVTGYNGNAHITSADQGIYNAGCVGLDEYVFRTGRMFEAVAVANNTVRIYDGSALMQGRHINLDYGTFLDVIVSDGSQSMNRNDLIVLRYTKDTANGVESVEFAVIQGTSYEGTAVDPSYTKGDIFAGATVHEMPLYRVKMVGVNIASVEPMFNLVSPLADIEDLHRPNLLLNSGFTCNQRREYNYNAANTVMYSVDMWRIYNINLEFVNLPHFNGQYSTEEGVRVSCTSDTKVGYLTQFVKVRELADIYTICAMADGKLCTFTTSITTVAQGKQFDKFKITVLYLPSSQHIKVNICPNGTDPFELKYVDLYEGDVPIRHIKEDPTVTLMKCQRYVRRISDHFPIIYSYPGATSSEKSYVFAINLNDMEGIVNIEQLEWRYQDTNGHYITGQAINSTIASDNGKAWVRTSTSSAKHADCYAIDVESCLLTCEHAPKGED